MTAFPEIAWREKTGSKQDGLPVRHRQKNSTLLCNYLPLQKWFDALRHGLSKHFCFLTFDLEIRQRVEQRALGHQLLVDGVLETHGAGVGTRHCQIGLHGWINKQRVCWKKKKKHRTKQNKTGKLLSAIRRLWATITLQESDTSNSTAAINDRKNKRACHDN